MSAAETRARATLAEAVDAHRDHLPCRTDPDAWHSQLVEDRREAAAACAGCPIAGTCLATAAATHERWGVWGGVDLEDDIARHRVQRMWQHVNGTTESTTDTEETAA